MSKYNTKLKKNISYHPSLSYNLQAKQEVDMF